MGFCKNCGKELKDGARFCIGCGTPVNNEQPNGTRREIKYEGDIHKCPNCGAVVKAFDTACPECGFEFRNTESSNAVKEFSKKLEKLEAQRTPKSKNTFKDAFGFTKTDPIDDQIINIIRSFNIPNNKEDIIEFMILASSNINLNWLSTNNMYEMGVTNTSEQYYLTARNDAWLSKFEQAYEKANVSFSSEPDFYKIKDLYERTKKSIQDAKKQKKRKNMKLWLPLVLFFGLLLMYFPIKGIAHVIRENKLEDTVKEIQTDIANGNYDLALVKAQTLHMDDGWSNDSKWHWDEQREALISIIEEKTGKKNNNGTSSNTTKDNSETNVTYKNKFDINSLDVDAVYPLSDMDSKLYANIQLTPEIIYNTLASENKLRKTPYVITGKVIKTFSSFEELRDYYGSDPDEDDGNEKYNSFLIENEYGRILIQDIATYDVQYYSDLIESGKLKNSAWYNKYINEFGGYGKYELPKEGQNVAVLGIYSGYSTRFNVPICFFGLNEMFYDTIDDDL